MIESIVPLAIFGTLLLLMLVFFIFLLILLFKQRMKEKDFQLIEEKHLHENELLRTRVELHEQALDWISREVHDNVGQVLSVTRFQLKANIDNKSREELANTASQSAQRIGACIHDLRNMTHTLNGEMVQQIGLNAAIERELGFIRSLFKLECNFDPDYEYHLSGEQELLLFRICQECLNNVVRHSGATCVRIAITQNEGIFQLTIEDNGKGMDTSTKKFVKGMGLSSIRQRVRILGGTVDINSAEGKGCKISITLKLTGNEPTY